MPVTSTRVAAIP